MNVQTFDNVWDAISDTPEQAENMKIRARLMQILNDWIAKRGLSQEDAAKALGITQPRVSELARGKVQLFSVDKLISIMAHAGILIERIEVREPEAA